MNALHHPGEGRESIADLLRQPGIWRGGELEHVASPAEPTGHAALDAELPGGGWPTDTLSEVLHDAAGIGEVSLLHGALARASQDGRLLAWVAPPHLPYAPALARAGLALDRCVIARPANREDALWTAEQALKSGACGAVLLWLERHPGEYAWLRRVQMAAQAGGAMAILFRSTAAERHATPSHLRVVVEREQGALRIRIPKRRGRPLAHAIRLDLASHPSLAPRELHPLRAPARRPAFHFVAR